MSADIYEPEQFLAKADGLLPSELLEVAMVRVLLEAADRLRALP